MLLTAERISGSSLVVLGGRVVVFMAGSGRGGQAVEGCRSSLRREDRGMKRFDLHGRRGQSERATSPEGVMTCTTCTDR
jgi:hypothetical protein